MMKRIQYDTPLDLYIIGNYKTHKLIRKIVNLSVYTVISFHFVNFICDWNLFVRVASNNRDRLCL